METLRQYLADQTARRRLMTVASGVMLALGFFAGHVEGMEQWRTPLLFAAAIVAGWDIALRALGGLRRRQVTIE